MRAIVITRPGPPEVLKLMDVPDPQPERGEVRVRVHAVALNQADILQRMGRYPAPHDAHADIPGLEYAGVIDKLGADVVGYEEGDRVFGLTGGGSYAEYVVVHHRTLARIPDILNFADAAAVPEAFITAYDAMITQGRLTAGEYVLINAIGSGVGTAAIQIANVVGAIAIGTTRTPAKIEKIREYGLRHAILARDGKFASEVNQITGERGVDLILELAGGIYLREDIICAAPKARILIVGLLGGATTEINFSMVLTKRLELRGTTLRMRPLEEKILATRTFAKNLVPYLANGVLRPVVDKVMKLQDAADAHAYLQEHSSFGKVVLTVD